MPTIAMIRGTLTPISMTGVSTKGMAINSRACHRNEMLAIEDSEVKLKRNYVRRDG